MASPRFPSDVTSALGQFWQPDHPQDWRTGVVRIEGSTVALEVSPALTPSWVYTPLGNGTMAVSRPTESDQMTILGSISTAPSQLSIWGARTTTRHQMGMPFPDSQPPESHSLEAEWCLLGSHLPKPDMRFHGVRIDVSNLTEWARIPGVDWQVEEGSRRMTWGYEQVDDFDARLPDGEGYLTLGSKLGFSFPDLHGVRVNTAADLVAELTDGWTLADCFRRLTIPLTTLMTLLSGKPCGLRSLSLWRESEDSWSAVYGRHVDPQAPAKCGELLLDRIDVGVDFLPNWLALNERLGPVPHILAAVIRGELPTVEAEALALVTAMEALHRTLAPGVRRFEQQDVDAAVAGLQSSTVPPVIRKSLQDALGSWWPEYSYPMRVSALAEPVATAVPQCVGRLGRWKQAVVNQRVALAHGLETGGMDIESLTRMHALNLSIRWTLLIRLLLLAGVSPEVLLTAAGQSERFSQDADIWRTYWPRVFPAT